MKKMILTALMAILAISAFAQKHWTNNPHAYANTMTVVGVVVINEAEIPRESMEVGAFCNGECRGSETLRYNANVERYLAYLSISGADGDAIMFKLYDAETETELLATAATVTFESDLMLGRAGDPYVFDFTTVVDEVPIVAETNEVGATGAGGEVVGEGSYLYGEECTLTAVPDSGSYFLNWTENITREEVVVSTDRVYKFVVTGKRDLVANFTATNPNPGSEQTLELNPGWNWISSYLECNEDLFASLKEYIAAANAVAQIKDMTSSTMLQNGKWSSSSLEFVNESMYMINLPNATTVTLTAPRTNAASHPVTLQPGWNWIGYPSDKPMSLAEAMSGITPHNGDQIKNMSDASTYSNGAWGGSLVTMTPGEGYMYYNKDSESHTLVYPDLTPSVQGTVEVPEGMDASNIVITNFSEEVVPNEDGEFEIGYGDLLMAINPEYDKPVYFNLVSLASDEQRRGATVNNVEMSAKETALFLALRVFPNGMGTTTDEWLNALKNILYPLDCVQQLEQAVQQSVNQYGYLNEDDVDDEIESVRAFFYETLVTPMIESFANNRTGLNPPVADPDHLGQLAKLEVLSSGYDHAHDVWNIHAMCWNAMGIGVGVVPALEVFQDQLLINPNTMIPTAFVPPTLLLNMFSPSEVFSYEHFVNLFNDVGNMIHGNGDAFATTGVSHERVEFNLTRNQNAISFVGPDNKYVEACNFLTLAMESVKFIVGNLVSENNSSWLDISTAEEVLILDEVYSGLILTYNQTHDKEIAKTILRETIQKLGAYWLANGFIDLLEFEAYNKYTAMLSAFEFGLDVFTAYVEYSLYQPFFFPVGGEHEGPAVGCLGFGDVSATSANVAGVVCNEGTNPVVERGFEWACTDPSGETIGGNVVAEGSGSGVFTYHFDNLYPNTNYFGFAWARHELGGEKYYGDGYFNFTTLQDTGGGNTGTPSEGALNGAFTINANGDQVHFSQGNLQYIGSAGNGDENNTGAYWKFADHQWDYLGDNGQGSESKTVDRDLFEWGTSGYNHGANCYQPWSTSCSYSDYYAYGSSNYNLYDQTGQADWGYNAISNGGNQENGGWRTLTNDEWAYLLYTRSTSSGICYAKAQVNGVNGVILLPDDWSMSYYALNSTNTYNVNFSSNVITATQWSTLEQHGAVFLPAAGKRGGIGVFSAGSIGHYWSASSHPIYYSYYAYNVHLDDSNFGAYFGTTRDQAGSVRLVRAAQ